MTLNEAAEDFVRLALEIDTHEPGYVDAYFGPKEWRDEARRAPSTLDSLKQEADRLVSVLERFQSSDEASMQRARALAANAASSRFRLDMIGGVRAPFAEEVERLFDMKVQLKPLETYDRVLARIDSLVPGTGSLADRVDAYRSRFAIPAGRLKDVMDAAIAECRRRTLAYIDLPAGESFELELVRDKSWSAYNYYKGDNRSLIEINTDLPVLIDRAVLLGCHEGYPGHHVQGVYNERQYRQKGWVEFSIAPLYAPASPLNEGGADFGVDLAFPGDEREAYEARVLYPLAGLDPALAQGYADLREALEELGGARLSIAQMYLDGEISRETAIELTQRYQLVSRAQAEQSIDFTDEYRSYVINYELGEDVVRAYVDRAGSDADSRWAAYERILANPILPSDLGAD